MIKFLSYHFVIDYLYLHVSIYYYIYWFSLFLFFFFFFFSSMLDSFIFFFFFFNDPPPPEFSPLPLHAALPISLARRRNNSSIRLSPAASPPMNRSSIIGRRSEIACGQGQRSFSKSLRMPRITAFSSLSRCAWSDRKSTRLNSSHLVISYAVFCL